MNEEQTERTKAKVRAVPVNMTVVLKRFTASGSDSCPYLGADPFSRQWIRVKCLSNDVLKNGPFKKKK